MARQGLYVEEVRNDQDLLSFIRLPWEIYRGDPHWVPPLIKDHLSKFSPTHPFRSHAKMILFLARKGERPAGRIAGIIDYHYITFIRRRSASSGSLNRFLIHTLP